MYKHSSIQLVFCSIASCCLVDLEKCHNEGGQIVHLTTCPKAMDCLFVLENFHEKIGVDSCENTKNYLIRSAIYS